VFLQKGIETMGDPVLIISDESDDNGELPSLDFGSDEDANFELKVQLNSEKKHLSSTQSSGFPCIIHQPRGRGGTAAKKSVSCKTEVIDVSFDAECDDDFELQEVLLQVISLAIKFDFYDIKLCKHSSTCNIIFCKP
jgi:hypothetical protein